MCNTGMLVVVVVVLIFSKMILFERPSYRERETQKERYSIQPICCQNGHNGWVWDKREPRAWSPIQVSQMVRQGQPLSHFPHLSQIHQGFGSRAARTLTCAPVWNASIAGSSLACCAVTPSPSGGSFQHKTVMPFCIVGFVVSFFTKCFIIYYPMAHHSPNLVNAYLQYFILIFGMFYLVCNSVLIPLRFVLFYLFFATKSI